MSDHVPCVVVNISTSPNARLRLGPSLAVRLTDSFWAPRLRINRDVTLPAQPHEIKTLRLQRKVATLTEVSMLEESKE